MLGKISCLFNSCVVNVGKRDEFDETPLHLAAQRGDLASISRLVKRGADMSATSFSGYTPLAKAISEQQNQAALLLIDLGADVDEEYRVPKELCPIVKAAYWGNTEVVSALIAHGAKVNSKCEIFGSALHIAAQRGHGETVNLLLKNGAVDTALRSGRMRHGYAGGRIKMTAAEVAEDSGHHEIAQAITEATLYRHTKSMKAIYTMGVVKKALRAYRVAPHR